MLLWRAASIFADGGRPTHVRYRAVQEVAAWGAWDQEKRHHVRCSVSSGCCGGGDLHHIGGTCSVAPPQQRQQHDQPGAHWRLLLEELLVTNSRRRPCLRSDCSAAGTPGMTSLPRHSTPSQSRISVRIPRSACGASTALKIEAACGSTGAGCCAAGHCVCFRRLHWLHGLASCVSTSIDRGCGLLAGHLLFRALRCMALRVREGAPAKMTAKS